MYWTIFVSKGLLGQESYERAHPARKTIEHMARNVVLKQLKMQLYAIFMRFFCYIYEENYPLSPASTAGHMHL